MGERMKKIIAVLVRDRQEEGLRMAVGLTLKNDIVDVYVLDREVEETEMNKLNLETIEMMNVNIYSNLRDTENMQYSSNKDISEKLLEYDHIIPY